jgi:toxin ParE1/3/4
MQNYKLVPAAEKDLESIWHYTVQEWGIRQAEDYIDQMDEAFQLIAGQPLMCRERQEFSPPVRMHHQAHHLIVYTIEAGSITVIRILHESMDIDEQLSD